ncbi:hypothetical protein ACQKLP_10690 [Chitinophaga sp. NPDC101104]|uniref:hypothetical protein n=1 Tax=Chitinophaga sp. NPDC101104 TaxID=3390561 RepID=UPI003CFEE602
MNSKRSSIFIFLCLILLSGYGQLKFTTNQATYFTPNAEPISLHANKLLKIKEPHWLKTFAISPSLDSILIYLNIFVPDSLLLNRDLSLTKRAFFYAEELSKLPLVKHFDIGLQVDFVDRKLGMGGNCRSWIFDLTKQAFDTSIFTPRTHPTTTDQSFWKRLKQYDLPENDVLDFDSDTSIIILHYVKDSSNFPVKYTSFEESKESLRLIYEVLGSDVKRYKVISEVFFDPILNNREMPGMYIMQHHLHENPMALFKMYRLFFPYNIPYCGNCD